MARRRIVAAHSSPPVPQHLTPEAARRYIDGSPSLPALLVPVVCSACSRRVFAPLALGWPAAPAVCFCGHSGWVPRERVRRSFSADVLRWVWPEVGDDDPPSPLAVV